MTRAAFGDFGDYKADQIPPHLAVLVCTRCGAVVGDVGVHDDWHESAQEVRDATWRSGGLNA